MTTKQNKKWNKTQAEALRGVFQRSVALLDPPPALPIHEWAELRRRMGRNVTAKPGRYRVATAPYQKEPQEAFLDPVVQTTVLYMAKRLGKTELEMNLIGATIEQNPRNILVTYPTLDGAKKWSKQFFDPMRKSTPVLRGKIKERSRDASNTILSKEFPGGNISAIGANSPSAFRQVQAPVVVCDEIDAMEDGEEGDPVILAQGRAENYSDSVQVVSSTATKLFHQPSEDDEPGQSTGSRIHDWWLESDQRKWFVKNPCCGKRHVLSWQNVKWPEGHKHEETWYECPDCGAHWDDNMRVQAICDGEWRATAPFHGVRGYWLNGLNTTFSAKKGYKSKLHQMAAEFYTAYCKGESARITWKNTFLCEPHIEESEKMESNPLYERLEDYTPETLPEDIVCIFVLFDVQGDRLEYEIVGLGSDDESWGIEYGKILGDPEKKDVWSKLKQHLQRTFTRTDGATLKVDCVAGDHRHKGARVREFLRTCGLPNAYAVFGSAGKQSILVIPHRNRKYRITLHSVATDTAKDTLFARLKLKEMGARYMHYTGAKGCGYEKKKRTDKSESVDGYFEQLTAEEARITYLRGHKVRQYHKIRERNEALDLRVYFLAAIDILNPVIPVLKSEIKRKLIASQPPKPRVLVKPASRPEDPVEEKPLESRPPPALPAKKKRFSFRQGQIR